MSARLRVQHAEVAALAEEANATAKRILALLTDVEGPDDRVTSTILGSADRQDTAGAARTEGLAAPPTSRSMPSAD